MLMPKIITALSLLIGTFIMLVQPAHAVPPLVTVGPLDGKAGPSLPPIATPDASLMVEELADTGFPKELERLGDLPSAALEWQRIAHKAHGREREEALTNATRLYIALGQPVVASALITTLLTENPATPYAPEALYHISTGPRSGAQLKAREQLRKTFPENDWTRAALLHDVWQQVESKGKITQTYKLPQAEELKKRIKSLRIAQQQKIARAGAIGVFLPGAGHAFAGKPVQGLTVFMVWVLFLLAYLSACRHRHYAYSFLFIIPVVSLWLTSPAVAMQIVRDDTHQKLIASLPSWSDLRPTLPNGKSPTNP